MPSSLLTSLRTSHPHVPSRRNLLQIVATGALATVFPAVAGDASARKHNKRRKRRKKRQNQKPTPQIAATCAAAVTSGFGGTAPIRIAQTFTPSIGGTLASANLKLQKLENSQGDYLLHVAPVDNFGVPTNEVLAAASVANAQVPVDVSTVTFTFPVPAQITSGVPLALVLTRADDDVIWHAAQGDVCGGLTFESDEQAAPFTVFATELDFIFEAFVQA
jgi:hypothetical protein